MRVKAKCDFISPKGLIERNQELTINKEDYKDMKNLVDEIKPAEKVADTGEE